MSATDTPIKMLLHEFSHSYAAWLLNTTEENIAIVQELNTELPPKSPLRADLLQQVTFINGQRTLLHIEIQGKGSERPMQYRMLDYANTIIQKYLIGSQASLFSVVIYVGEGAGKYDTGQYAVAFPPSIPLLVEGRGAAVTWSYRVIHLWEMSAETLLALDIPALLVLIGQTRIEKPSEIIPKVIQRIKAQVPDTEKLAELLSMMKVLQINKEVSEMVDKYLAEMELDEFDTPYLRELREEANRKAEENYIKTMDDRKYQWIEEGEIKALREFLLESIALRFTAPIISYKQIEAQIENIRDVEVLRSLFKKAIVAPDFNTFSQNAANIIPTSL